MKINIRKIMCPLDFSESSDHALLYAKAFAQAHGADILLMHCVETPVYYTSPDVGMPPETVEQHKQLCERQLAEAATALRAENLKVQIELVTGSPFLQVVRMARKEGVDLIVMGTHGRTGLAHVLMGSVAEKVVRKAPCPVLTVKHPEHEFVMP